MAFGECRCGYFLTRWIPRARWLEAGNHCSYETTFRKSDLGLESTSIPMRDGKDTSINTSLSKHDIFTLNLNVFPLFQLRAFSFRVAKKRVKIPVSPKNE